MRITTLCFLAGILCLQWFQHLPTLSGKIFIAIIIAMIVICKYTNKWIIAYSLGFIWILWFTHIQSEWVLPNVLEGKTACMTGYIASIPESSDRGTRFIFSMRKFNNNAARGLVRLMWKSDLTPHVGDKWQFYVRLKKSYGTMNPGGFDYEAFAFQEGIRANGYVVENSQNKMINSHRYRYVVDRIREFFQRKIAENLPHTRTSPWITALAVGERHDISEVDWEVLRRTGTNHLMAIAGLHIGIMSGLAHLIASRCWRFFPRLLLYLPAQHAGAIAALIIAVIYSAMAGFSIPTQRACLMLSVFLSAALLRRHIPAWQAWNIALLCVLWLNPLSVLTDSFWLSFGSVALIIYGVSNRLAPSGWWWKWGRIQWVIALGLVPLSVALFQQCSFIAFMANSIAIPWVGCLVVPLCLLGCVCLLFSAKLGGCILGLADNLLGWLWHILTWLAHLPGVVWYQSIPHSWIILLAVIGVMFLLLPVGFPGRYIGIIWALPLILFKPPAPKFGDVWLTLLDVGQGLSAVMQTQKHTLVFDAGSRFGLNYDMGNSVVVPFLHAIGTRSVDMLIVSHGDNDHIGGAYAVLNQFQVRAIKTSVPQKLSGSDYCLRGHAWQWDGVKFEFLYPTPNILGLNNNSSCVLRVTSGAHHVLLTGDIEKLAERELVESMQDHLSADILVAPHHGSKTSAIKSFVESVHPSYVLFAVGYRNRYHFPHSTVLKTYEDLGAISYDTIRSGAIQFQLSNHDIIANPTLYRLMHKHYWNN